MKNPMSLKRTTNPRVKALTRLETLWLMGFDDSSADNEDAVIEVSCSRCRWTYVNNVPCHESGCLNRPIKVTL